MYISALTNITSWRKSKRHNELFLLSCKYIKLLQEAKVEDRILLLTVEQETLVWHRIPKRYWFSYCKSWSNPSPSSSFSLLTLTHQQHLLPPVSSPFSSFLVPPNHHYSILPPVPLLLQLPLSLTCPFPVEWPGPHHPYNPCSGFRKEEDGTFCSKVEWP